MCNVKRTPNEQDDLSILRRKESRMSIDLDWKAYVEFLVRMNQCTPEVAVERAANKLKAMAKGDKDKELSWKEQNEFLKQFYRVNPYRRRYDR